MRKLIAVLMFGMLSLGLISPIQALDQEKISETFKNNIIRLYNDEFNLYNEHGEEITDTFKANNKNNFNNNDFQNIYYNFINSKAYMLGKEVTDLISPYAGITITKKQEFYTFLYPTYGNQRGGEFRAMLCMRATCNENSGLVMSVTYPYFEIQVYPGVKGKFEYTIDASTSKNGINATFNIRSFTCKNLGGVYLNGDFMQETDYGRIPIGVNRTFAPIAG